jgi:hypothetical protein
VGKDDVDGVGQLRMVEPDDPILGARDRYRAVVFGLTHDPGEVAGRSLAMPHGLVTDNDALEVQIALGEAYRGRNLAFVTIVVPVYPGSERDIQPEPAGNFRDQLEAPVDE